MFTEFQNRTAASIVAADLMEAAIQRRLGQNDEATIVVSGGSTPQRTLVELSGRDLAWSRVNVVPSDERWVDANSSDSNALMIRQNLVAKAAHDAKLVDVYDASRSPDEGAARLDEVMRTLPFPYACALLGMGEDGHFASLFPDAEGLATGLDVDGNRHALCMTTAASPHPRVSLTLASLSRSDEIVLLIFGAAKREVYERAAASADAAYPVSHLLWQKRAPVRVFWAE